MSKKLRNTNKGITLIALVITIIVMLILVAVTITMAINGGLFNYAGKAATKTNEAIANEQELANLEANLTVDELINKYTGGAKGVDLSLVNVGDYVSNYPVEYTNVESGTSGSYTAENKFANKWRVLEKVEDDKGNVLYVKLISAGVPLAYYHGSDSSVSIEALTTNFLTTEITSTKTEYKFCRCGFENVTGAILESLFTNKFTQAGEVHALTKTELDKAVIALGGDETSLGAYVNDEKYKDLFALSCSDGGYAIYWLATACDEQTQGQLHRVHSIGYLKPNNDQVVGVRPVVSLNSNVQFTQATEKINDTTTWDISI